MTDWYSITNEAAGPAVVEIYDRIGAGLFSEGVEAKTFVRELSAVTADAITLRVNSPGGSVFDGQAIAGAIARHPATVTAHIDGLAASIATVIALAADRVVMADNALFMIHDPQLVADGNADAMRSAAALLDRVTDSLVTTYRAKTGADEDTIRAAMAAETWYTADEALTAGFVDEVIPVAGKAAALFDLTAFGYRNAPQIPAAPVAGLTERITVDESTDISVAQATDTPAPYATASDIVRLERQIAARADAAPVAVAHPLAAYKSLGEYSQAAYRGDAPPLNVLVDQIGTNNPGVLPPNWATDVKNIVAFGRPGISALGVQSAGESGMDFAWPYYDGDITAIVAAQAVQKTLVNSVRIDIKKGSASLATYAAASDVSYQLIMRSQPSYLDAHNRIMAASYATVTDNAFVDALLAGGTPSVTDYDLAADTDGSKFRAAVFTASMEVETATGSPASVVLVSSDVFAKIGGWDKFVPAPYGTQNVPGTATASTLRVDVSGLPVVHDRNLAAGSIIATNASAAKWIEDGPAFASAESPTLLGRDVAIFGFGVTAIYNPKGVVKITNLP